MRSFLVKRAALGIQPFKNGAAVGVLQQRSVGTLGGAAQQGADGDIQPHRKTQLTEQGAVFLAHHNAAAGRDDRGGEGRIIEQIAQFFKRF